MHNHVMVKVVSNYMVHTLVNVLSSLGLCTCQSLFLASPFPITCFALISSTHPQVCLYSASSWKSTVSTAGWHVSKHWCHLVGLTWLLVILSRKTPSSSRAKTMIYLGLYPQCLAHSGHSNILAELVNKKYLNCLSVSLRDSLYPP